MLGVISERCSIIFVAIRRQRSDIGHFGKRKPRIEGGIGPFSSVAQVDLSQRWPIHYLLQAWTRDRMEGNHSGNARNVFHAVGNTQDLERSR